MSRHRRRAHGVTDAEMTRRAMWRLGMQVAGSVAVIVALLCGVAVAIVLNAQHSSADALLDQAAAHADDVSDPPAGGWLVMRRPSGTTATPGLPAGLPDSATLARTARTGAPSTVGYHTRDDHEYRIHTEQHGTTTTQAILSLRADHRERARLVVALLVSGGIGLLLAAAAGLWFGRRAVRPMAAALALQRRFVADASHELRTPLTLLSTRAQMLRRHYRRGDEPPTVAAEIDGVVTDAGHLSEILEDLLLAADTTATQTSEAVDLRVIAAEVVAACDSTAAERSITVSLTGDPGPVQVSGVQSSLRRAVTALVDNALRHADRQVIVRLTRPGAWVVLDVVDDGPGIAPEMLPHVFERFTSTGGREYPAGGARRYGLGLALVADVAARHGGSVTADNPAEGGAALHLTLPVLPS